VDRAHGDQDLAGALGAAGEAGERKGPTAPSSPRLIDLSLFLPFSGNRPRTGGALAQPSV